MAGAYAQYKLEFTSDPNIPLILNLLTQLCGAGNFTYSYQADVPPHYFMVSYPSQIDQGDIDQCLNGHDPIARAASSSIMGGGTAIIHPGGMATGSPNIRAAVGAALSGEIVDEKFGNGGDPLDDGNPFSGVWIVYPAVEYPVGSGNSYNLMLIVSNQIADALNIATGLTLRATDNPGNQNYINWLTDDSVLIAAQINAFITGATPNRSGFMGMAAAAETGGTGQAFLQLSTVNNNAINSFNSLAINDEGATPTDPIFQYTDRFGNSGTLQYGDSVGYLSYTNNVTENDLYRRTISGGSLGTLGVIHVHLVAFLSNGSGSSRFTTLKVYLGSTVLFTIATTNLTTGNTVAYFIDITITNTGGASSQYATIDFKEMAASALGAPTHPLVGRTSASVNMTSDQDVAVTGTMSAAASGLTEGRVGAYMLGPNYD